MNFGGDDNGPQRPIVGSDSLDQKIVSGPSALERRSSRGSSADGGDTIDTVHDADVLCGRGKSSFNHPGNKRFRDLITSSIQEYDRADSRLEKSLVVHSIVEGIRSVGGRFLKTDQDTGKWTELDDRACREKVGHAIRDAATISQTRRQRKKQIQSQTFGSSRFLQPRGPTARFTEMKMDTPDPVCFHDMVSFSNMMSGPRMFPPHGSSRLPHGPLVGSASMEATLFPSGQGQVQGPVVGSYSRAGSGTSSPPDDASFLAQIDEVLGPMSPSSLGSDPLADLLNLSTS
ncbi:expressed unknown protein [Seminavis robusta]|uniref:DUF6824 domain-containing protein n=1 Tax=Seminavis robusta TaxID=568900 RepID=A0A9N8E303_9STRA|nr:expressed unknown protein [Seminavis robusta]|eukprot:Sro565_g167650.1 n/a (288) ;mRNA; f:43439-44604